jgi:hypothetical protein
LVAGTYWRTTPLFLETFKLNSLDELYQDGALQELFPLVYSSVMDDDEELEQTDAEEPPVPPTEP